MPFGVHSVQGGQGAGLLPWFCWAGPEHTPGSHCLLSSQLTSTTAGRLVLLPSSEPERAYYPRFGNTPWEGFFP